MELPSLAGQRVLVTGGLGFIGSNIAHQCLRLGAKVKIYDCLDPKSGGNMFNIESIQDDVELVLNDIRNFEGVSSCIRKIDVVFNCAAYTSHPNSMKEPFVDVEVNCRGTLNLLEAARRFNPTVRIVHLGTSTQIGRMVIEPINENHPEYPADIYSANKTASEKYVLIYGSAYKIPATVVRLANVYGPRSNIRSPEFGFMNYFIGLGLQNKTISVYGEGVQKRNISFIDDSVNALILASQSNELTPRVFFASSNEHWTVGQIASAIVETIGGRVQNIEWPKEREAIEVGDNVFSNDSIVSALGWKPEVDLLAGLKRTAEFFRPNLKQYS